MIVNCQLIDTGESSDYPQGPYPNGGGEADSPQRCDRCEVFLRNPLTTEGLDYVRRALKDALGQDYARRVWEPFYREALQAPRGWSHV